VYTEGDNCTLPPPAPWAPFRRVSISAGVVAFERRSNPSSHAGRLYHKTRNFFEYKKILKMIKIIGEANLKYALFYPETAEVVA